MAVLFVFCAFLIFLSELRLFSWRRFTSGRYKDRGSLLLLLLVSLMNFCLIGFYGNWTFSEISNLAYYIGLPLMGAGFILREWSIRTLKHLFTPVVSIHDNHQLVTQGPYCYVRHPSYSGLLLEFVGLSLAAASFWIFIIVFLTTFVSIIYRIRIEERALVGKFNSRYTDYQKTTKGLVPLLL